MAALPGPIEDLLNSALAAELTVIDTDPIALLLIAGYVADTVF